MEFLVALLRYAVPVGLASLGETIGQRAGVLNIGLEGCMLVGAFFGMRVSLGTGNPWLGLVAGGLAGLGLGLLAALFCVGLQRDQVVVGTAINLLALGVTGTLFRAQFGQSGQLLSVPTVPRIGETGLDAVILVTIVAAIAWSWALRVSAWGLVVRAVGEFPKAVEAAGFSVPQLRTQGLAISGLFGGLGGAYLALGIAGSFAENMVAGRGFLAIAMVTFGRWKPVWVLVGTLLIGGAESLQFALQARGVAVPYQLMIALPYVVALVVLVAVGRGVRPPEALGIPYRREA